MDLQAAKLDQSTARRLARAAMVACFMLATGLLLASLSGAGASPLQF